MTLPTADIATIDSIAAHELAATKSPGFVVDVSDASGSQFRKGYGVSDDLYPRPAMTTDLKMRIASSTKMFVGTAIMVEIGKGTINLSDTLVSHLPTINVPNQSATVEQMLSHRSGIPDYLTQNVAVSMWSNTTGPYSDARALTEMRSQTPAYAPGAECSYSNSNFVLLGMVLAKVTGKSVAQALQDNVFTPAGLADTSYPADGTIDSFWAPPPRNLPLPFSKGWSPSYLPWMKWERTEWNPNYAGASGAIITTVADLAKFMAAQRDGTLITPSLQAQRESQFTTLANPNAPYPGPANLGIGLAIVKWGEWLGHNGGGPGFSSFAVYHPTTNVIVSVLSNYFFTPGQVPAETLGCRIVEALYPGTML